MLVGSNMPIFGGGRYPAVSLRLRSDSLCQLFSGSIYRIIYYLFSACYTVICSRHFGCKEPDCCDDCDITFNVGFVCLFLKKLCILSF